MAEGPRSTLPAAQRSSADLPLHPAWQEFMKYCRELRHGEIGQLRIQDGLPVMAELVTRKVKFTR